MRAFRVGFYSQPWTLRVCRDPKMLVALLHACLPCCLSRAGSAIFSPHYVSSTTLIVHAPRLRPSRKMSSTTLAAEGEEIRPGATTDGGGGGADEALVQYVVLRRDLIEQWPLGSTVSQGCHAAVAAVWAHRSHPDTAAYLSPAALDSMHKVTLEVKGETQLRNLAEKLVEGGIDHKMWIEQPENIPTCIATRPYRRSQVASYFKKLKLCK